MASYPRDTRSPELASGIGATVVTILLAGALATVVFDLFGQAISPGAGFPGLAPVPLANAVLNQVFGINSNAAAHAMHLFGVGIIGYPIGWLLIARPILRAIGLHWFPASILYGIGLWGVAIGGLATYVGNPFFLGFSEITWVALAGHIIYAVVLGWAVNWLDTHVGRV